MLPRSPSVFNDPAFRARVGLEPAPTGAGPWARLKKKLTPPVQPVFKYEFKASRIMPGDVERIDLWIKEPYRNEISLYAINRVSTDIDGGLDDFEKWLPYARFSTPLDFGKFERKLLLLDVRTYLHWLYNHLVGHVQPLVNETAMRDTMANAAELAKNRHFFEAIRLILRRVDKTLSLIHI